MSSQTTRTTVSVSTTTRDELFDRKEPTESYDDVIARLLSQTDEAAS